MSKRPGLWPFQYFYWIYQNHYITMWRHLSALQHKSTQGYVKAWQRERKSSVIRVRFSIPSLHVLMLEASVLVSCDKWKLWTWCCSLPATLATLFFKFSVGKKISNFQQMAQDRKRQGCRPDRRAFHSPAFNNHSNTSVKSNNFTINEIPICLQCISRWHFPHCNSALIKFLKCKNASKRLKTSPSVSVPGRGLWYLIFISTRPGHWKPEC